MRIFVLFILLCLSSACYAENVPSVTPGTNVRLSCFSIASKAADKDEANGKGNGWIAGASCDSMCAARGAVCTAAGGYVTPSICTDVPPDNAVCRCCAVAN